MENEPPKDKKDLTPEELAKLRLAEPITPSEREAFVGRIQELEGMVRQRDEKIKALENPEPPKKKKGFFDDTFPL